MNSLTEIHRMANIALQIDIYDAKRHYPNRRTAAAAAETIWRKQKIHMREYRCPICNEWHLTSKGERGEQ